MLFLVNHSPSSCRLEQIRRIDELRGIARKFGINTGYRGLDKRLLATVNHPAYGGTPGEYANLFDVPPEILMQRLNTRVESKWNDAWYKAWGLEKPKEDTLEEVAQIEQRYIDAARAELEAQACADS